MKRVRCTCERCQTIEYPFAAEIDVSEPFLCERCDDKFIIWQNTPGNEQRTLSAFLKARGVPQGPPTDVQEVKIMGKKNVKKAKRLNPGKVFNIDSITRAGIAQELNEIIECRELNIKPFWFGDARLTDDLCRAFAQGMSDAITEVDEVKDKQFAINTDFLEENFGDDE